MDNPAEPLLPYDREGSPRVLLGGREWPVPLLAARENRIIDPLILQLLPLFEQWRVEGKQALGKLGPGQYDALQEIAYQGIRRAHPELTRDAFMNLPITLPELIAAFTVIARQTGMFERAVPGEASAEATPQK